MKWILIYWLASNAVAATSSIYFDDEQACRSAVQIMREEVHSGHVIHTVCVPAKSKR
jgi:hypothetical protein